MPDRGQLGEGREHRTRSQSAHACPPLAGHLMWSVLGTFLRGDIETTTTDEKFGTRDHSDQNDRCSGPARPVSRTPAHNRNLNTREPLNSPGSIALQRSLQYPSGRLTAMNMNNTLWHSKAAQAYTIYARDHSRWQWVIMEISPLEWSPIRSSSMRPSKTLTARQDRQTDRQKGKLKQSHFSLTSTAATPALTACFLV